MFTGLSCQDNLLLIIASLTVVVTLEWFRFGKSAKRRGLRRFATRAIQQLLRSPREREQQCWANDAVWGGVELGLVAA
jgi:hypothetical protein